MRAVLPELELSFDPIDRHFEGDDGSCQLFVKVHREIFDAPGLRPGALVYARTERACNEGPISMVFGRTY